MDESVNWYLHWAERQIELWWGIALPYLTSDMALRLYVLTAALTILGASIHRARRMMLELRSIEMTAFSLRKRGPKPFKPETIERFREELRQFRKKQWRKYLHLTVFIVFFGFIVPSIGLYLCGAFYHWFDPAGQAFVAIHSNEVVVTPDDPVLAAFVFNQFTHGAMMDIPEVFQIDAGQVTNNPANYPFTLATLLYRTFVGSFAVAMLFFFRRAIAIAWALPRIEDLVPLRPGTAAS